MSAAGVSNLRRRILSLISRGAGALNRGYNSLEKLYPLFKLYPLQNVLLYYSPTSLPHQELSTHVLVRSSRAR